MSHRVRGTGENPKCDLSSDHLFCALPRRAWQNLLEITTRLASGVISLRRRGTLRIPLSKPPAEGALPLSTPRHRWRLLRSDRASLDSFGGKGLREWSALDPNRSLHGWRWRYPSSSPSWRAPPSPCLLRPAACWTRPDRARMSYYFAVFTRERCCCEP